MRAWALMLATTAAFACTPEFEPINFDEPDAGRRDLGVPDLGVEEPYDGGVVAVERRVGWSTVTSGAPIGRDRHAMAYSPKDRAVLLYGGVMGMNRGASNETLVWDGRAWVDREPEHKPNARCDVGFAEDKNGDVVLFGGALGNNTTSIGETWIWDGVDWHQHLGAQPPRRNFSGMAYDHARERIVLYGGALTLNASYNDTWEWTGSEWIERTPVDAPVEQPPIQAGMRLAFDSERQRIVMVGGVLAGNDVASRLDTMWEWNGDYWEPLPTTVTPGPRTGFAMTYDIARNALVIFSGTERGDSAELVRGRWRPIELGDQPHWVYNTSMVYDRARGRAVLFGGFWSSVLTGHQHESTTYELVPLE